MSDVFTTQTKTIDELNRKLRFLEFNNKQQMKIVLFEFKIMYNNFEKDAK